MAIMGKMRWALSASFLACAVVQAGAAMAEDKAAADDATVGVSDILVLGRGYENRFAEDKALATIRDTPSSITIIDTARIEKQRLLTLDDVMKQTSGVTVVRNVSTYPRFFARGFQISSFLIDGTPQQGYASAPYSMPDLFLFDHVEFLRGPSALFSGSGSPGGSVNLVRKRPKDEFAFTGSLSAGSWDFYRGEVDLSSPLNKAGTARARVGAMVQDAGDFMDEVKKDRKVAFASFDLDLGDATTFSAGGYYDDFDTTLAVGLPAGTDGLLDLPRDSFFGGDGSYAHTKQAQYYAQLNHSFADNWKARATIQYNDLKRREFYLYARGPVTVANGGLLNLETYRGNHQAHALSADASLTGDYELFGRASGIILGADYQRSNWKFQSNYLFAPTPPLLIDVNNPVPPPLPSNFPVGPGSPDYYSGKEIQRQYGIYGQTRIEPIENFTIVAGGRIGWVTYKTQDFDLTPNGVYTVKHKLSPYVGLVYEFMPKWTLYGSYADVFEPQSAFDRNGNPLGPVSGTQLEAGIKTNIISDSFLLTIAAYRIRQSNRAVTDPVDVNFSISSGLVEGKGFEIELNGKITPQWSISGGYNYNRNRVLSDTDPALEGTQFTPVIPKHSVKLFTDYDFEYGTALGGLSLGGAITWNGRQRGNGVTQGSYFVADVRAGYDVTEQVNVSVNLNNLFDKKYYAEIRDRRFSNWYGAPRSAFATVRVKY